MNYNNISTRFLKYTGLDNSENIQDGVEFDPDDLQEIEIEQFQQEPYYFEADESNFAQNKHHLALNIDRKSRPNLNGLVETCRATREVEEVLFEQGMWVEYLSNDMQWKVGVVNRVVKQPPDDWDYEKEGKDPPIELMEIYYNVGVEGIVSKENIRAPAQGLEFIFGKRPWLWQQFTLLQLEKRVRFDENHEYDFNEIDNVKFATTRFDAWLEEPRNVDFKEHFLKQPEIAQKLLKNHLISPFLLMDMITERKDEWDFDDPDISVYTYWGVLGAGSPVALATLAIQILAPLILLYALTQQVDGDSNNRFTQGGFFPVTTFREFCEPVIDQNEQRVEGRMLIVLVLIIYLFTVLPDSLLSFFRTSGGASSTFSKINSLRNVIWRQNDDDIIQQIGFKVDRMMNTGYIVLLYTFLIFVLIQTPIVLDIILNALAIEFIHDIDERIANSDWWDEDNRWIMAGTIELVLQGTLRLRIIEYPRRLCHAYDIEFEEYKAALGGAKSLRNRATALKDDKSPRFMSKKERIFEVVAERAQKKGDDFILDEYRKSTVQFGIFSNILLRLNLRSKGLFNRYEEYRTWSLWDKILYLPAIPHLDEQQSSMKLNEKKAVRVRIGIDDYQEFFQHIILVLTGVEMISTSAQSFNNGNYLQVPTKIILGLMEIILYWVQILFPVIILGAFAIGPICY